mgnify:CR=1 FL=1
MRGFIATRRSVSSADKKTLWLPFEAQVHELHPRKHIFVYPVPKFATSLASRSNLHGESVGPRGEICQCRRRSRFFQAKEVSPIAGSRFNYIALAVLLCAKFRSGNNNRRAA